MLYQRAVTANPNDSYGLYRYAQFLDKCNSPQTAEEVGFFFLTIFFIDFFVFRCFCALWKLIVKMLLVFKNMVIFCLKIQSMILRSYFSLEVLNWLKNIQQILTYKLLYLYITNKSTL